MDGSVIILVIKTVRIPRKVRKEVIKLTLTIRFNDPRVYFINKLHKPYMASTPKKAIENTPDIEDASPLAIKHKITFNIKKTMMIY